MRDPTDYRAYKRAVSLSANIEVQLRHAEDGAPLLEFLERANRCHAAAVVQLATVDPESPAAIRDLQAAIKAFALIVDWMREIVAEGKEAGAILDAQAREEMADYAGLNEDDDIVDPYSEG